MNSYLLTTRVQPRFWDGMGEVCLSASFAQAAIRHWRRRT
jgi:hypothetical protein